MFSHDGKGTIEEIAQEAIKNNLSGFAITDHCDCEYADDKEMLNNLALSFKNTDYYKKLYKNNLIILTGIEIGEAIFNPMFAKKMIESKNFDMVLGSVHAVRKENFDMPFSTIDFSTFNISFIEDYISQYFIDLLETAITTDYDVLSHLTVIYRYIIHKFGIEIDASKHLPIIEKILIQVINRNKTLEINTSGFHYGYLMPDLDIIKMYKALGGKSISLGSDAHIPNNISLGLYETAQVLKQNGFNCLTYYSERKPIEYKF